MFLIVALFLFGIMGFAVGLAMKDFNQGCHLMVISALLSLSMIVLGIGMIAWTAIGK